MNFRLAPVSGAPRVAVGRGPFRPANVRSALSSRILGPRDWTSAPTARRRGPAKWTRSGVHRALSEKPSSQSGNKEQALPTLISLGDDFEAKHQFSSYANWIIPGQFMVGRYPFIEPSRCTNREQAEKQLRDILETGIRTFISLQDELPPQKAMRLGGVNGFVPYKPTAELIAASLEGPPPAELFQGIRNPTLNQYLPPRKKGVTATETKTVIHCLHRPIVDLSIPGRAFLEELIESIDERLRRAEFMYVHCWGGRGRAGTVAGCFLVKKYNMTASEALERVARGFATRGDGYYKSPETQQQIDFVHTFAKEVQQR